MALTTEQWSDAVIRIGRQYATGEITAEEMQRRLEELRSPESMALIDALDEIELFLDDEEPSA